MIIIIPILIYIVVPIIWLILFFSTSRTLKPPEKKELFTLKLLTVFGCHCGLTILLLTTLFWKWSGIVSLLTAFLILLAPILMAFIAFDSYKMRKSRAENKLCVWSISYFVFLAFIILIAFIFEK